MTVEEDKRGSAEHEAGHLTVALAMGVRARAWIEPTHTQDPVNERPWTGKCEYPSSPNAAVHVGGAVAEWLVREGFDVDPQIVAIDLTDEIALMGFGEAGLSETDSRDFPKDWQGQRAAIRQAVRTLKKHEAFFRWAAQELLTGEVITDGMAWEKFYSV